MKIIIFGGAGFLGSHVADELINRNHKVIVFDKAKSNHSNSIIGSILDYKLVNETIKGADVVYNFAAISDIDKLNPVETLAVNTLGNTYLLNAACANKIKRFIFASTIYVHSDRGSFYASSKRACEDYIKNYQTEYNLPFTILRYGSLYGPRANKFNWIYRAIHQALTENKITRQGDGEEIREYIHVKDAATLSADILKDEYKNQCITITGNQQLKIKDLHIMIKEILNKDIKLEYIPSTNWSSHYEITPYTFKPSTAKKLTSNQYHDLGQGLLECIEEIYKETQK